jgi:hypothetical protein
MQRRIYIREWRGIDLTTLPAARDASDRPAGPALYTQFYEALRASAPHPDPAWADNKVRLGEFIATEVLGRWRQQHGRSPRILALAAGEGLAEGIWLEQGWNVTLQEVQPVSLATLSAKFPHAPTVIGDVRELGDIGKYDIVAILASEYVLSREELRSVFQKVRAWLTGDGWFVVVSVSVLSLRQWAVEMVKALSGRHRHAPHVFWGWWRTPGEFREIAAEAGLTLIAVYREASRARAYPVMKRRPRAWQAWPLVGHSSLMMLFRSDGSH